MISISRILCFLLALFLQTKMLLSLHSDLNERSEFSMPLAQGLDTAETKLKEYYYQLVANNYFDASYNNQLVLGNIDFNDSSWHGKDTNIQEKGTMLLALIAELSRKNDITAMLLLQRVNKFFVFKMHRLLAENDLRKEQSVRMLGCLDDLYSYKIATPAGAVAPFRTLLTKTFIVLALVNDGDPNFNSRKETMLWHMNKLKHEYLEINRQLGEQKIDDLIIKDFITLLAVYETKQPIIQPNRLKELAIKALIVGAIILIIYWQRKPLKKYVIDPIKTALNDGLASLGDGAKKLGNSIGEGATEAAAIKLQANAEHLNTAVVKAIDEGINRAMSNLVHQRDEKGQSLADKLGLQLGSNMGDGLQKELTKPKLKADMPQPNALETTPAKELGNQIGGALVGVLEKELTHPMPKANIPTCKEHETTILKRLGEDFIGGVENKAAGAGKELVIGLNQGAIHAPVAAPYRAAVAVGQGLMAGARGARNWWNGAPAQPAVVAVPIVENPIAGAPIVANGGMVPAVVMPEALVPAAAPAPIHIPTPVATPVVAASPHSPTPVAPVEDLAVAHVEHVATPVTSPRTATPPATENAGWRLFGWFRS